MAVKVKNTLVDLASEIVRMNKNIVAILDGQNKIVTSNDSSVQVVVEDSSGNQVTTTMPSVSYIQSQVNQINRNIELLTNLNNTGAFIQNPDGSVRKIISVNLNEQPSDISQLNTVSSFESNPNWFFDSLMSKLLTVNISLTDKVDSAVSKVDVERHIVRFQTTEEGVLTEIGDRARLEFEDRFKNNINISYSDFKNWSTSTAGVTTVDLDAQRFELEPVFLRYTGTFGVARTEEDPLNNRIWFVLDSLTYRDNEVGSNRTLAVNDILILNTENATTRYKILAIDTTTSQPKVQLERMDGIDPIPVGLNVLKIYSPLSSNKTVKISVGYNEYQVVFVRPIRTDNHVRSENWSLGVGFYTNDLTLVSADTNTNGLTMSEYYINQIIDYGLILKDLVQKRIPEEYGETPNAPVLATDSFKVRVSNEHLVNSPDAIRLRELNNSKIQVTSEIEQLNTAIKDLITQIQNTSAFPTKADQERASSELSKLTAQKDAKSNNLKTIVSDILSTQTTISNVAPRYRLQGFFPFPELKSNGNTKPQNIVQFKVRYKYSNLSGEETPLLSIPVSIDGQTTQGTVSQWEEFTTKPLSRIYNETTGQYEWVLEDISSSESNNTNYIDLAISPNEQITLQVKSISEVGWPESPLESDWSEAVTIPFDTTALRTNTNQETILNQALQEDQRIRFENELNTRGLTSHVAAQRTVNGNFVAHDASVILTTHTQADGTTQKNLQVVLDELKSEVDRLKLAIERVKGEMEVYIRIKDKEYLVKNNQTLKYQMSMTSYAESVTDPSGIPTWVNREYVISDYSLVIKNVSNGNPLGLFSARTEDFIMSPYNNTANNYPLMCDAAGSLRRQNDNQFVYVTNHRTDTGAANYTDWTNLIALDTLNIRNLNLGWNKGTYVAGVDGSDPELGVLVHEHLKKVNVNGQNYSIASAHVIRGASKNEYQYTSDTAKTLYAESEVVIPINIFFLLDNRANPDGSLINGLYRPSDPANPISDTGRHVKTLTFYVEPENRETVFRCNIEFTLKADASGDLIFSKLGNIGVTNAISANFSRTRVNP